VATTDGTYTSAVNVTTTPCVSSPLVTGVGDGATDSTSFRYGAGGFSGARGPVGPGLYICVAVV
jgi:hypothetical protein